MIARFMARLEENALALLLISMTFLVFLEVVLRFVFNTGLEWAQEVTLHVSAWFVLFGASYGIKVGAHIGVDAVVRILKPEVRRIVSLVALALCLFYCALFLYGGWIYLAKMYKIGITMEDTRLAIGLVEMLSVNMQEFLKLDVEDPLVPLWFAHAPIVVGFVLLVFRFLQLGINLWTGKADSFHFADEAKEVLEHDLGLDPIKVDEIEEEIYHLNDDKKGKDPEVKS
ncbi:TRAP transporter small permease [Magnetococcus sp. PR-3]|uniref:TRAP transporter small permease n=1 Tax=Magnetococcus sp. PR-3 TaxID=3120355 RepID=UPI002FCE1AC3